jgi:hypothetical protein
MTQDFLGNRDLKSQLAPRLIGGDDVETVGSMASFATFSRCRKYRYILGRMWGEGAPTLVVCMLNPSTANDIKLDPTLRRVRGFAKRDHYGSFIVVNAFAYRSTDRKALLKVDDPVGPRNNEAIKRAADAPLFSKLVAGWGRPDNKKIERRMTTVLFGITCLHWWTFGDLTKGGFPRHPLYLPKDTEIKRYGQ